MKNIFSLYLIYILNNLVPVESSQNSYFFEKIQRRHGGRVIPSVKQALGSRYEYPEPLPVQKPKKTLEDLVPIPYKQLYQGVKYKRDIKAYSKKISYQATSTGHFVNVRGVTACEISHLAVETNQGLPIIMRGGVGYFFFDVVVKAPPGVALEGKIQAFCRNTQPTTLASTPRRMRFNLESQENKGESSETD